MPESKPCPTCRGPAYSEPMMNGPRWHAMSGRQDWARYRDALEKIFATTTDEAVKAIAAAALLDR